MSKSMSQFEFEAIGFLSSCFKEKFGIPRQPGLVNEPKAQLVLNSKFTEDCVRGLQGFSHIWLQFVFHATSQQGWKPTVRPPRLGGNARMGVYATRTMFRPNPLGLSVVRLLNIETTKSGLVLHLSGCDLLDGTPILDVKPYLPYVDAIPDAEGGFAPYAPHKALEVMFCKKAKQQCEIATQRLGENIMQVITQILELDPRPAYQAVDIKKSNHEKIYAMKIYDFDLHWQYCENNKIKVLGLA